MSNIYTKDRLNAEIKKKDELLSRAYTLLLQVDQIGVQGEKIEKLITDIKLELGL